MAGTLSPMVSVRQVVAMPTALAWYLLMTLTRPCFRLGPPPNTASPSPRALEAMSTGSRKWLIR